MQWYMTALKRWSDFSGRSRRSEYNWFFLLNSLAASIVSWLDGAIGAGGYLALIFGLLAAVASISVILRRFHDVGYSSWYALLFLVPLVNIAAALYLIFKDSQPGSNEYGPNPKGA